MLCYIGRITYSISDIIKKLLEHYIMFSIGGGGGFRYVLHCSMAATKLFKNRHWRTEDMMFKTIHMYKLKVAIYALDANNIVTVILPPS